MPASVVLTAPRGHLCAPEIACPHVRHVRSGALIDPQHDRAWFRMRQLRIHRRCEMSVLEALEEHIRDCIEQSGAEAYLRSLEDSASNAYGSPGGRASRWTLSPCWIGSTASTSTRNPWPPAHLPLITSRGSRGWGRNGTAVEDWVPAPEECSLPDLFVGT